MSEPTPSALATMMTGDPARAMEVAKQIIGGKIPVEHALLAEIASNDKNPRWTRIAAIYALGFLGDKVFIPDIRRILRDNDIDADIRSHAAEALGNIRDRGSIRLLRDVLRSKPTGALLESCNYALNEMGA